MDSEFTNRELYLLLQKTNETNLLQHQAILSSLENFHTNTNDTLAKLLTQTTRTNGRVTKLENWRSGIVACIALISFLIPITLGYFK
jgi:hypothetical protein